MTTINDNYISINISVNFAIIFEMSLYLISMFILEYAKTIHFVVTPTANILFSCFPMILPLALPSAINPLAYIHILTLKEHSALTMLEVILEVSLIDISITILESTLACSEILLEMTIIASSFMIHVTSLTLFASFLVLALVLVTYLVYSDTSATRFVIFETPFILLTFLAMVDSLALFLVLDEISSVDISITIPEYS